MKKMSEMFIYAYGRQVDLFGLHGRKISVGDETTDSRALYSDLMLIGTDFRRAMKKCKREENTLKYVK